MPNRRRVGLAAAATAAGMMAMLSPPAAQATSGPDGRALSEQMAAAPDLAAAMAVLSPAEKAAVLEYNTPVTEVVEAGEITEDQSQSTLAAGCYSQHVVGKSKAGGGNVLYTWWQRLNWCHNGSKVTSWKVTDRGGETSTPLWSYSGHQSQGSYNAVWEIRSYTQERFTYWAGTKTPCLQIRGGNGLYSSRQSCNTS